MPFHSFATPFNVDDVTTTVFAVGVLVVGTATALYGKLAHDRRELRDAADRAVAA